MPASNQNDYFKFTPNVLNLPLKKLLIAKKN